MSFIKNKTGIIVVSIIFAFFFIFCAPSFFLGIKDVGFKVLIFPVKVCFFIKNSFKNKNSLIQENSSLFEKVVKLSIKLQQFKGLLEENNNLRSLLDFKERQELDVVFAEIIARDPSDWIGSFVINKGEEQGIKKDSAVCSADGLVGKVVEVNKNNSFVMLISHPSFKAGAMIRDIHVNGIVVGIGQGLAKMLYIPIDTKIKENDIVVTSDFSYVFPKGIVIGKISSISKSKTGLYKYAIIKPSADPFKQERVLCIR